MSGHAYYAPSSADRWGPGGCPASPRMEALYPEDEESPEAREGTAAHYYLTETLAQRHVACGSLAPNGFPVDIAMIENAADYIRDVRDTVRNYPTGELRIESRVVMLQSVSPLNWGTPDTYLIVPSERKLFVWDYKYGHRYVDAFGNWQTVDYVIGCLETHGIPRSEWHLWTVTITIIQPRNYHPDGAVREWVLPGSAIVEKMVALREAATACDDPNAPMVTGPHCLDCRARQACPAAQRAAMALCDLSMTGQPYNLGAYELSAELRLIDAAIKRLEARRTGLFEQGKAMAREGANLPFHNADYSYGRQRFNVTPEVVIAIGQNYGINLAKATSLTPKQAIKAGMPEALIEELSETPRGGMTLVPFDATDVAKRFG